VRIPVFPHLFSKEMTCCGSKNDFCKKLGGLLFSAKVQNHPGSSEIGWNLHKIKKNTFKGCRNKTRADMRIPGGLLFMWGVFPSFRFRVLVAASQKNPILVLRKWQKHFSWCETKIGPCGVPRHPKGHARVRYGLVLTNYAMLMAESSSFNLKVMQPRT
jgi:hypothetical protein